MTDDGYITKTDFQRVCRLFGRILCTVCPESKMESYIKNEYDFLVRFTTPHLIQEFETETPEQVIELASDFIESVLLDPTILEEVN
jgi:hypothetical protein